MAVSTLGIDVGSTNLKACLLNDGEPAWSEIRAHEGDLRRAVHAVLTGHQVPAGIATVVTGQEGRRQFRLASVIAPVAVEKALQVLGLDVDAVVSVGGEDLVIYTVDSRRRIVSTFAGNKCASGTGEFFAQQLARMDMSLADVDSPKVACASLCKLSSRCSVFMKSDCTHKLNKGEADRHDIALSLSSVTAKKVLEFLAKAKVSKGRVLLVGGATRNPHLVRFVREGLPGVEIIVPPESAYLEAFGAAHLALEQGQPLPNGDLLGSAEVAYARAGPLTNAAGKVTFVPSRRGTFRPEADHVLGVDGGSTTTKVALVDAATREVVASHYGRTLGDPVAALKKCLLEVRGQLGGVAPRIRLVATTGSSRELLGVFCGTPAVYNEIIAHTVGTTFFDSEVDTVFEIGGQDAKYVHLRNHVPVDYAMNEACSAGTGSFLEESAAGDLDIHRAEEIGPIALKATAPLLFGEHCSAFINSDIRKAVQQGASREDIVAGLVLSIVSNYLNRVVGNRRIGNRIVLQGGVAKNPAMPLAFAALLEKPVVVPPDPELMGAFGVALLALQKQEAGELSLQDWSLEALLSRTIEQVKEYRCKACDNSCPIRILDVSGRRCHFGGRCNKYSNLRKKAPDASRVVDWVEVRRQLYFERFAAPDEPVRSGVTVAVPDAFSVHSLWPLYSNFFHALGVKVERVAQQSEKGASRCESSFCYPAEIAHGLADAALALTADWVFLPHFKAMPSYQSDVHACLCPIMQGLPYYLRTALGDDPRVLRPVLDFSRGLEAGEEALVQVAERMGFLPEDGRRAFALAVERQVACYREGRRLGREAAEEAARQGRPVIVLCGRPYNAFTPAANMGIPRKFTTRGYSVLPYDFLPVDDEEVLPNMYWYYGQQNLKAAVQVKGHKNLFACYVTNFSCAPDSFILHYLRWISNTKPFLVLELDSHTADAGVDTRVEAFLDIVERYRRAEVAEEAMLGERDWDVRIDGRDACVVHRRTGVRRTLKDPRVRLIWPSMGSLASQLISQVTRSFGIDSVSLPPADVRTTARARAVASGKECIPALLVLGSFLEYFARHGHDPDRVYLLFMPLTTGPCRTGQYAVFYQNLFQELGYRNVVVLSLSADNSYAELGPDFNRLAWHTIVLGDYMRDVETTLRALAVDREHAAAELAAVGREMTRAAEVGVEPLMAGLAAWAKRLASVPLAMPLAQARKVLVVGEIYVRRDDFSVESLLQHLSERRIVAKITSLSEWIHYLDWEQERRLRKKLSAMSRIRRLVAREARKLARLKVEMAWKHWVEMRIKKALAQSGLIPEAPHGMEQLMSRAEEFTSPELESEASLSPCVAAAAMDDGWDGVAVIAPFACLPGRLIEALYVPWARSRGLPVLCLENDGNAYPPAVVSRIEIFAHNVSRGQRGESRRAAKGLSSLFELPLAIRWPPGGTHAPEAGGADSRAGKEEVRPAGSAPAR